jgi:hypothetical protein
MKKIKKICYPNLGGSYEDGIWNGDIDEEKFEKPENDQFY